MPFELVIFDCDGVLVDSEPIASRVLLELLGEAGLRMTAEEVTRTFLGLSAAACRSIAEERLGHPLPPTFDRDWNERLFTAFRREVRPVPGIEEVLDRLRLPVCVASSGSRERMRVSLGTTGLLPRFDRRLFSSEDVGRGKPHPDVYLHAAKSMEVAPERCAVVEDSPVGVRAGVVAGMTVFGFAGNRHPHAAALRAEGAIPFLQMLELPALLRGHGASRRTASPGASQSEWISRPGRGR